MLFVNLERDSFLGVKEEMRVEVLISLKGGRRSLICKMSLLGNVVFFYRRERLDGGGFRGICMYIAGVGKIMGEGIRILDFIYLLGGFCFVEFSVCKRCLA